MRLDKVRVLITGVGGFVGRFLCHVLSRGGDAEIFGLSVGPDPQIPGLTYFDCDIGHPNSLRDVVSQVEPQHVYHLAAISAVPHAAAAESVAFDVNVFGTRNLLQALASMRVKPRVLNVSTAQVYDDQQSGPLTEDSRLKPMNMYAVSKAMAEMWSELFRPSIDWINVRAFNHTGPGQSSGFAVGNWAEQVALIMKGLIPPELQVGNLNVERDFTDVRDVVAAYLALMNSDIAWQTFNVSSGKTVRLSEIVNTLVRLSGRDISVVVDQSRIRTTDPQRIVGDNSKIMHAVGWSPRIPIEQTLKDMLAHHMSAVINP